MKNKLKLLPLLVLWAVSACSNTATAPNTPGVKPPTANSGTAGKPMAGALTANDIALLAASGKGDNAKVSELLGQGANVNVQNDAGSTPLIEAVYNNHIETVKLLLEKGADPNARKKDGATALGFAKQYPPIVELLKSKGATIESNQGLDIALLDTAGKGDLAKAKELVEKGAYVNYHDKEGRAPIIEAAYNGRVEVVKFLLEKGADPNSRKNDGASALGFAKKYPQIVEMLKAAGAKE